MTGMLRVIMQANGMEVVGVCPFESIADKLLNCMAKGRIPEDAKSVIMALFPYKVPTEQGNLSRYAVVPDYHEIAGRMLDGASKALAKVFPAYKFVWFTDNSPVPEVYAAALSGLGVVGDNGLLINKRYGSYCFIGSIITTLDVPSTGGVIEECLHCGKCLAACPGGSLQKDGFIREKCLSFISQRKGVLSDEDALLLKQNGLVWGCDVCQNVCPLNEDAEDTYIEPFLQCANPNVTADDLATAKDRAYLYRGRAVVERNINLFNDGE